MILHTADVRINVIIAKSTKETENRKTMEVNKIIKPEWFEKYAVIPFEIFRKKGVSMAATGLYSWLFSHEKNQDITMQFIAGHFKDGKDAINSKIKELESLGFLKREEVRIGGRFAGYNFHLDLPNHSGKTAAEKTIAVNPPQSNIHYNIQDNVQYNIQESNIPQNVLDAFPHYVDLFDKKHQPRTNYQKNKWLECLEKIQRIDGYDLRELYQVVKRLREDQFWQTNFLSLLKLRNRDKNGILYVDRFMAMKSNEKPKAYKMIPNLIKFYTYKDPAGKQLIGAITKGAELDDFALAYKLGIEEYQNLFKYLQNDN